MGPILWGALAACAPASKDRDAPSSPSTQPTSSQVTPPDPTTPTPPAALELLSADVRTPDSLDVYLVAQVDVSTNLETSIRLDVTGPDGAQRAISFASTGTNQRLPLVGLLQDSDYTVDITATTLDGTQSVTSTGNTYHTGGIPAFYPNIDVLAHVDGAIEPGWTVLAPWTGSVDYVTTVLDGQGRPVWAYHPDHSWRAVSITSHGTVIGLQANDIVEVDWLGDVIRDFGQNESGVPPGIPIDDVDLTHEVLALEDGSVWTLVGETATVDNYPQDYDFTSFATSDIYNQVVVHYGPDGTTLDRFSMVDMIDPTRIGFDSLNLTESFPFVFDWAHGNAVLYDADDDAVLVSLRHQDAVIKFDRASGQIKWILGNHDGWSAEFAPYLLTPVGEPFEWQGHQHAPMWLPGNKIVMFDNGNNGRGTPYGTEGTSGTTRIVEYTVDETAMTISQDWEWWDVPGGKVFDLALGNADVQPTTGNVFGTFSYLFRENGSLNTDIGRGAITTRLIEFSPTSGKVALDLDLWGDAVAVPDGWLVDRATRAPTLYGTTATDTATGLE